MNFPKNPLLRKGIISDRFSRNMDVDLNNIPEHGKHYEECPECHKKGDLIYTKDKLHWTCRKCYYGGSKYK